MLLDTIFAPFVKERPICVMARAVLERLLDAPRIDALFARTAQQQYTRELLFSSLVQLMSEVVLGVHPPVHAAYQANPENWRNFWRQTASRLTIITCDNE